VTLFNWMAVALTLVGAAILEVGGDAMIRKSLEKHSVTILGVVGFIILGCYGIAVNLLSGPERAPGLIKAFVANQLGGHRMDFSSLLGVYVAVFAVVSVVVGRFVFRETVLPTTWLGLIIVVVGGLVIQFGPQIGDRF